MPSRRFGTAVAWLCALLGVATPRVLHGAAAQAGPVARQAQTIERVLAVVDERPVLLSEVRALAVVRGLAESAALEAAIDERLMYGEASRLAEAEVSAADETAALDALYERQPALRGRVVEADLRRLARRQLAILKYVEFRFRPQVRVSDDEVRKAWEAEEVGRPSGLALEDAEEAIRARLERRALDERIESWIGELRARAEIRVVEPAPSPSPPPPPTSTSSPAEATR